MKRLESTDIISDLEKIMKKNTKHFQGDFNYDKEIFWETFKGGTDACKDYIWLTRENGTNMFKEFDSYIEESPSHTYAVYYGSDCSVACFAVHLDDIVDGKITGTICSIDYMENMKLVETKAVHVDRVELTPMNNDYDAIVVPYGDYSANWMGYSEKYGKTHNLVYRASEEDEKHINSILYSLKTRRTNAPECSLEDFLDAMKKGKNKELIEEKIAKANKTIQKTGKRHSSEHSR